MLDRRTMPAPSSLDVERNSAIGAVVLSAVSAMWNGANASEHVQINRDGGLYLNAGKWIATHGTLNVSGRSSGRSLATPRARRDLDRHEATGHPSRVPDLAHAPGVARRGAEPRRQPLDVPHRPDPRRRRAARVLSAGEPPAAAPGRRARRDRDARAPDAADLVLTRQHDRDPDPGAAVHRVVDALRSPNAPRSLAPRSSPDCCSVWCRRCTSTVSRSSSDCPLVFAVTWLHTNRGRPQASRARHHLGEPRSGRRGRCSARSTSSAGTATTCRSCAATSSGWPRSRSSRSPPRSASCCSCGAPTPVRRDRHERGRAGRTSSGVLVLIIGFGAWFVRPHIQHVHAAGINPTGRVRAADQPPRRSTAPSATPSSRCGGSAGTSGRSR